MPPKTYKPLYEHLGKFVAHQVEGETLLPPSWQREIDDFPEYYHSYMSKYSSAVAPMRVMVCTGPVSYAGQAALAADVANLRAALADPEVTGRVTEAFLPSTSPSGFGRNEYYATEQDYLAAVAEAMRAEYLAIVEAGFLLQVDDPWLIEILTDDGRSDPADSPRDGGHVVDELRALLSAQDLKPPYVLVGHSLGGLYMQLYARRYPDEVSALVLVDSTHPNQFKGAGGD